MNTVYTAYGLSLRSDVEIPGLTPGNRTSTISPVEFTSSSKPDWVLALSRLPSCVIHSLPAEPECSDPTFVVREFGEGEAFQLAYGDGTEFFVDAHGAQVWGSYVAPMTLEDLATYLLGPVMGFVLRRRGITPLHASAVSLNGFAIAICGGAGAGKSTTTAAMALRGWPALCEDIAALREADGRFSVQPGYRRVCLWPDAVEKLLGDSEALPNLTPTWDKKFLALDGTRAQFEGAPTPLSTIYLLGNRVAEANAPHLEDVSPKDALLELVQNTYMNALLDRKQRATEFELLSRLVTRVRCRRAIPHQDPKRIPGLCELIEADAQELARSRTSPATEARS